MGVPQAHSDRVGPRGSGVNRKKTWHVTLEEPRTSCQETINIVSVFADVKDLILLIPILILILIIQHVKEFYP